MAKAKPFATEAELCKAFLAEPEIMRDWTAYAETAGWDILLVRKRDSVQIGIQAKLRLNPEVLNQSLPGWNYQWQSQGPDYRAILVPYGEEAIGMDGICRHVGVEVLKQPAENVRGRFGRHFYHHDMPPTTHYNGSSWHPWFPLERHKLPDYVPDVVAGDTAPMTLSPWKIQAIKLCIVLEERPLTRADIKAVGISPTRWLDKHSGYLMPCDLGGYVASRYMPDFKRMHPKNWEDIRADKDKWMWVVKPPNAKQGVLV